MNHYEIALDFTDTENLRWCNTRETHHFHGLLAKAKACATRLLKKHTDRPLLPYQACGDAHIQVDAGKGGFSVRITQVGQHQPIQESLF